jgi:hypothetical protein
MDISVKIILAFITIPLAVFLGAFGCTTNYVDSYWEEERPCGSSTQGTFISNEDGSWSDWVECKGFE